MHQTMRVGTCIEGSNINALPDNSYCVSKVLSRVLGVWRVTAKASALVFGQS